MKKLSKSHIPITCLLFFSLMNIGYAQVKSKEFNNQGQSWISINSTLRFTNHWGAIADVHYRANHMFTDPNFFFARTGINYWLKDNITFTLGYGHMWVAPTTNGWHTYSNENRLYEQAQIVQKIGTITMLQRIRNEQRWQQKIANDVKTGSNKFTDRIRYLLSFTIPIVPSNKKIPSLVLADELCIQFGKEVLYNTFDQNRAFIGIKENITKNLSFDLGYMNLLQQKASGYQYDNNSTFRCFFYYTPDFRKKQLHSKSTASISNATALLSAE